MSDPHLKNMSPVLKKYIKGYKGMLGGGGVPNKNHSGTST